MSTWLTNDYRIAAGHNNVSGLTLVTAITASGLTKFVDVRGVGRATLGAKRVSVGGVVRREGYHVVTWLSSYMTVTQHKHIRANYSGLVTVRTTLDGITFANYNAVLDLPDPSELTYEVINDPERDYLGGAYLDVVWTFSRLEAI